MDLNLHIPNEVIPTGASAESLEDYITTALAQWGSGMDPVDPMFAGLRHVTVTDVPKSTEESDDLAKPSVTIIFLGSDKEVICVSQVDISGEPIPKDEVDECELKLVKYLTEKME